MTKKTTVGSHRTKTAVDKTSKAPRASRHQEDIVAKNAPAESRRTKTADGATLKAPRTSRPGPSNIPPPLRPTEPEIAERAYYRYLERTGVPGNEFDDWIQAERDLCAARGVK